MDKNGKRLPTQGMLFARILVGGYLVYLGFSLFTGKAESTMNPVMLWLFIVLFSILGIFLIVQALLNYSKGNYQDGALDVGMPEETSEEDIAVVESTAEIVENTDNTEEEKIDTPTNN